MNGGRLPRGEGHVWLAPLAVLPSTQERLRRLLSADERERVERFHRRADRDRQAAARGWLRLVLARYAGRPAAQLAFGRAACGKPYLEGDALGWLRFNVSHGEDRMLVVIADGLEVGIDLEWIRPGFPITEVAEFALSVSDRQQIAMQPEARRCAEFYACWTRLEARAKAGGEGLVDGIAERSGRTFSVIDLDAGAGFAAAVAIEGGPVRIRSFSIGRSSRGLPGILPVGCCRPSTGRPEEVLQTSVGQESRVPLGHCRPTVGPVDGLLQSGP